MQTDELFKECLSKVPRETKRTVGLAIDISNKISDILKKRGMSQRDLARLLGKRENEISRWLNGSHNFTIATIAKIESALGENILLIS